MTRIPLPRPRSVPRQTHTTPSRRHFLRGGVAATVLVGCPSIKPDLGLTEPTDTSAPAGDTGLWDTGEPADTGEPTDTGPPTERFDVASVPEDIDLFPTAIQAGAMKQESALLAIFVGDAAAIRLRVWQPLEDDEVALYLDEAFEPDRDGYLKVHVSGLAPGEWYAWCALRENEDGDFVGRSLAAQFRTALPDGSREPVTVAISSCNGSSNDPWPALLQTAEEYYDLFIHLGDMAYNDACSSLTDFRESWRWYLSGDGFRAAYARSGLYATWDDHEITNNWSGDDIDPTLYANAQQSMFEVLALEEDKDRRLWRRYRWGETVEFFVLDCRDERSEADGHYISPEQLDWLLSGLSDSPCHFKVVAHSVPITNMPPLWDLAADDRWEGFPGQRQAVLDHIKADGIRNVWFVSGDFHVCFVARVEDDLDLWEVAVSGGNSNPLGDSLNWFYPDQFPYSLGGPRTTLLTFDPDDDTVLVRFINPESGAEDYRTTLSVP